MNQQRPEQQEKGELVPTGRGRWVLVFFSIALIVTFFAGFFVQRSFFAAEPKDAAAILDQALHSKLEANALRIEFPGTKTIPHGPGLNEWLEEFPESQRIRRIKANYVAIYAFDPNSDWDLQLDPIKERATLQAPLPDFVGLRFSSTDIEIEADPALSGEETELARRFLEEKLRRVLSQEEEDRMSSRLDDCRKRLMSFAKDMLDRERIGHYQVELSLTGDQADREEL